MVRFADRIALLLLGLFLIVHVPVRAYIAYHVNRGQHAVVALDDWTPIALRSEYLIPGVRLRRLSLPNLENGERTRAYLKWMKQLPAHEVSRKFDIMWIVGESFRADAINERATPYLWHHAPEFQLKLDCNHWSGGNNSQFGLFSMFFGVSGYHMQTFNRAGAEVPFFNLLARNGYRVRLANRHYFDEFGNFKQFLPPSILSAQMEGPPDEADAQMTDALLAEMESRPRGPALDIVTFDATHWPFFYPAEDDLFQPATQNLDGTHFTRTRTEAAQMLNRFRNASHGVDRQIGRIMEFLRARGALDHTIVIIAGDHGEEFMERGQVFHSGAMDDFQGRPVLWMHWPDASAASIDQDDLTSHIDIVPTLLDLLGYDQDVLRTQGQSLLHPRALRSALFASEQGYYFPYYNALITKEYISRWRNTPGQFWFSGVARRDGQPVVGEEWLNEARSVYLAAAREYEVLPDVTAPPPPFRTK